MGTGGKTPMLGSSAFAESRRIAILIDADNSQPSLIEKIIAETSRYGLVTIRRIYGDWTTPNMNSWRDTLHVHAIQPIQQFRYTIGKNATDSAMIIDAMDILHEGVVSGFCLISSDSDFTRLATRIREKGLFVMGIGNKTTPRAFVNACEVFVFTQNLAPSPESSNITALRQKMEDASHVPPEPLNLLKSALEVAAQDDDGWAFLGAVGNSLRQLDPSFDPRTYGHRQLSQLVRRYPEEFEINEKRSPRGRSMYIRLRKNIP